MTSCACHTPHMRITRACSTLWDHVSLVTEKLRDLVGRAATTIATGVKSTKTAVLLQVVYQWTINAYRAMLIIIPTDFKRTRAQSV